MVLPKVAAARERDRVTRQRLGLPLDQLGGAIMIAAPTPSTLRNHSRRLDRLNAGVARVLHAMRNGATLHLEFYETGPKWRMSNGRYVNDAVARIVITDKRVVGVGDTLVRGRNVTDVAVRRKHLIQTNRRRRR